MAITTSQVRPSDFSHSFFLNKCTHTYLQYTEARVGFGSNLTLPVPTYFTTPQTGLFKFFIFGLFGVTNEFGVGVWTAEVNYGPTTSNTTVNAKAVGEFEYVNF